MQKLEAPPTEVFAVLPGVEMTVKYATADDSVCRIEIPSGVATQQQVEEILEKAVPASTRGKKWNEVSMFIGLSGFTSVYYERVLVMKQEFLPKVMNKNPGASITFKTKVCGWKSDSFAGPPRSESKPKRK